MSLFEGYDVITTKTDSQTKTGERGREHVERQEGRLLSSTTDAERLRNVLSFLIPPMSGVMCSSVQTDSFTSCQREYSCIAIYIYVSFEEFSLRKVCFSC